MPAILGALGAMLITLARQYLPGLIGRVLLAFGIGLTTYNVVLPALKGLFQEKLNALPPVVQAYAGAIGIDVVFVMILSAFAANRAQRVILSKLSPSN